MATLTGIRIYAEYSTFVVGSSATNYALTVGGYSGNAGMFCEHVTLLLDS